jgi:hypothetical protein
VSDVVCCWVCISLNFQILPGCSYFVLAVKVKGKVVPVLIELSTTPWRRMGEWMCRSTFFLTSALAGGEWSASRPGRFTPGERAPGTHWIWGWVGPRAGLDNLEKRKFLTLPGLELWPLSRPARSQPLYRLRYPGSFCTGCTEIEREGSCKKLIYSDLFTHSDVRVLLRTWNLCDCCNKLLVLRNLSRFV